MKLSHLLLHRLLLCRLHKPPLPLRNLRFNQLRSSKSLYNTRNRTKRSQSQLINKPKLSLNLIKIQLKHNSKQNQLLSLPHLKLRSKLLPLLSTLKLLKCQLSSQKSQLMLTLLKCRDTSLYLKISSHSTWIFLPLYLSQSQ